MLDIYMSSVSYRISTVMKVLTVITTIFMPLSLIAGIYGDEFPTLAWAWLVLGILRGSGSNGSDQCGDARTIPLEKVVVVRFSSSAVQLTGEPGASPKSFRESLAACRT